MLLEYEISNNAIHNQQIMVFCNQEVTLSKELGISEPVLCLKGFKTEIPKYILIIHLENRIFWVQQC